MVSLPKAKQQALLGMPLEEHGQDEALDGEELDERVDARAHLGQRHAQDAPHERVGVRFALLVSRLLPLQDERGGVEPRGARRLSTTPLPMSGERVAKPG
jgi:hypothetical protein